MKYVVEGNMKIKGLFTPFVKEIEAQSESRAKEMCYNRLGSDHKLLRTQIQINKISEMKA